MSVILFQFEEQFLDSTSPTPSDLLECVAHECPDLMRKGKTWIKQNSILASQLDNDGERGSSVVQCLTGDRGVVGLSFTRGTVLCL